MNETADLKDITPEGKVPETRLNDPDEVRSLVINEIQNNEKRQKVAALVKGLVDGNPPYKQADLDKAHQKHRANFNTGEAMSYLSVALSGVYDLFSEVPTYATVACELEHPQAPEWSRILTEEFDRLQRQDMGMDYHIQVSQHDMILYGSGPQVWMNTYDWRSRHARYNDVIYPRQSPSDVNEFEYVIFRHRFTTTQLFQHMHNENAARRAGWNPEMVKSAIVHASTGYYNEYGSDWDHQQQRLRNNDLTHGVNSKVIDAARVVYQEYPKDNEEHGKISECWIVINNSLQPGWLFTKLNRYDDWNQCICPFFLDKGDGTAHSVKGLGVRMYKMLLAKMRLDNATVDTAFARSALMFKATTPKAFANSGMVHMGPYTIMPPDLDFVQVQSSGLMDGSMGVSRHLDNQLAANLSQFRQRTMEYQGTPRTATEKQLEAQQQSQLNKTQISRYYQHLDMWYAERWRRAVRTDVDNDMPGQREASMFRRRCQMRGVPMEALAHCRVTATRAVGQGNPWVRINMLESLTPNSMSWPDEGRQNLQKDIIAAKAGMHSVKRYYPEMGQESADALEQKFTFRSTSKAWSRRFKAWRPAPIPRRSCGSSIRVVRTSPPTWSAWRPTRSVNRSSGSSMSSSSNSPRWPTNCEVNWSRTLVSRLSWPSEAAKCSRISN